LRGAVRFSAHFRVAEQHCAQTSKLARRICADLAFGVRHTLIRAGRPQTNGAVEVVDRVRLEYARGQTSARSHAR
jgi:transposase InsO family protein